MQLIDLSHTIEDGLVTYKGLPAPLICDYLSREASKAHYDEGTTFQIGKLEMVSNTGTYIDCPFHRFENGEDLNDTPLEKFIANDTVVIRYDYKNKGIAIDKSNFIDINLRGKALLINTEWSKHWNTETYFHNHPFLTNDAAWYLNDQQVKLIGIDSYNIDDTRTRKRPVHTTLLGNGILIVEHMTNLASIPDEGFEFHAVPPKIKGMGTFPVRAFAKIHK